MPFSATKHLPSGPVSRLAWRLPCLAAWLGLTLLAPAWSAPLLVTYPKQESANNYPAQVLQLALQESGIRFALGPSETPMPQGRALQ